MFPSTIAQIFLHLSLFRASFDGSVLHAEHVVLTMDSPHAAITICLPTADPLSAPTRAYWDRWIERFQMTPSDACEATASAHNIILHLALIYRAITCCRPHHVDYNLFLFIADWLMDIARTATGQSGRSGGGASSMVPSRPSSPGNETVGLDMAVKSDYGYGSYDTDSSEEPDPDSEEEELIAHGFLIYE
ncbi:hypothetical protein LXA43DRAFT_1067950 [Ganoderma leucocontextum]|nr:hypothetical protein LXA43DRAFT_1067950 [Ganoderma leucocontextum]